MLVVYSSEPMRQLPALSPLLPGWAPSVVPEYPDMCWHALALVCVAFAEDFFIQLVRVNVHPPLAVEAQQRMQPRCRRRSRPRSGRRGRR